MANFKAKQLSVLQINARMFAGTGACFRRFRPRVHAAVVLASCEPLAPRASRWRTPRTGFPTGFSLRIGVFSYVLRPLLRLHDARARVLLAIHVRASTRSRSAAAIVRMDWAYLPPKGTGQAREPYHNLQERGRIFQHLLLRFWKGDRR